MKSKMLMEVIRTIRHEVVVEVGDDDGITCVVAEKRALAATLSSATLKQDTTEARLVRQLGEPWVYVEFVDNPHDLIVFRRSVGNTFTKGECDLLVKRVAEHVGGIDDHWNGAGCTSFSVRSKYRGPRTAEREAALTAPRPADMDF